MDFAVCRTTLFDIAKKHGLHLEQEPQYGGRKYLEKQDFIIAKQKKVLTEKNQEIKKMEQKISDVETLIDDVADTAY